MREIVPLVCSGCGGPVNPNLSQPCRYCGAEVPHDVPTRARLRRHAERSRRLGEKLRAAALHEIRVVFLSRDRRRERALIVARGILEAVVPWGLAFGTLVLGFWVDSLLPGSNGKIAAAGVGLLSIPAFLLGHVVARVPLDLVSQRAQRASQARRDAEIVRCEAKLELTRAVQCGGCGARSTYVHVALSETLECPYCRRALPAQCDAFDQRLLQAVEQALIDAHVDAAVELSPRERRDASAALMELAGYRELGGIFELPDAPSWVHSRDDHPWRCIVNQDTALPGRLLLLTPETEPLLAAGAAIDTTLPEVRTTLDLGNRRLLAFADREVLEAGFASNPALQQLAGRLSDGELVQLDGAGATAFRFDRTGDLDAFARVSTSRLFAAVRGLA